MPKNPNPLRFGVLDLRSSKFCCSDVEVPAALRFRSVGSRSQVQRKNWRPPAAIRESYYSQTLLDTIVCDSRLVVVYSFLSISCCCMKTLILFRMAKHKHLPTIYGFYTVCFRQPPSPPKPAACCKGFPRCWTPPGPPHGGAKVAELCRACALRATRKEAQGLLFGV